LYRVLAIMTAIDAILSTHLHLFTSIEIEMGIDCPDIIYNLWNMKTIFSITQYMLSERLILSRANGIYQSIQ